MTSRLERFRGLMARLNPAASPFDALRDGLYVPRPGRSTADELAARLELDPTSTHLVVGGIGSGKTTQLLAAKERLGRLAEACVDYVNVSEFHDLSKIEPGILLVISGILLGKHLEGNQGPVIQNAKKQFARWAHGGGEWIHVDDLRADDGYEGDEYDMREDLVWREHKPVLSSPHRPFDQSVIVKLMHLETLAEKLKQSSRSIILLIDSLDRLADPTDFDRIVEQDVRALKQTGIGVVIAGPLATMYGAHRSIADHFQYYYPHLSVDPQDARGVAFLVDVLRKRALPDILTDAACRELAVKSGGVMRDLISLARSAGEEAYLRDADRIDVEHVEAAVDAFGRQLLFGLDEKELESLQRLRKKGAFVQMTDRDIALLVTRRVLEYRNGRSRFTVHPTIEALLASIEEGEAS